MWCQVGCVISVVDYLISVCVLCLSLSQTHSLCTTRPASASQPRVRVSVLIKQVTPDKCLTLTPNVCVWLVLVSRVLKWCTCVMCVLCERWTLKMMMIYWWTRSRDQSAISSVAMIIRICCRIRVHHHHRSSRIKPPLLHRWSHCLNWKTFSVNRNLKLCWIRPKVTHGPRGPREFLY